MSISERPKIDCHCHIFDPARFPYDPASPYHPAGQEIATAAQMRHVFAAHRVEHALLVQPNSGYGYDNSCMLDAIANSGGRWKGVAVAPDNASLGHLSELKDQGIVGIAINLPFYAAGYYNSHAALFDRIAQLDMWLQVQVEDTMLLDILPMLQDSGAKLLIDHCGRPNIDKGLGQPAFETLLDLGRGDRAAIKLSGYVKFSQVPHPFEDTRPFAQALIDAFGVENCIWGSDWPFLRAPSRVDYGPLLDLFADLVPEVGHQNAILWDNPKRLFGF
ncbi:amidohydrolase [Donghicola sp. XS_ASV15]|uniref:amidohydrolase family protein n=1 Tax=Donghicola sp. XS_ASV15 TaxID=3241295 RepID=UPI0035117C73